MALDDGKVSQEYLQRAAEQLRHVKQLSYQRMAIGPGDTVLDAGCGPGVDTVPLAKLVGSQGEVIGIDNDEAMLETANQYALENGVSGWTKHQLGSALALPLTGGSVDSCRAERLMQVLAREQELPLLKELVRVTKPGGRVVLVDTDWGSASVDCDDAELERRLMSFFASRLRPNGFAGRRLYALCQQLGLEEILLDIVPLPFHDFEETPFGKWLFDSALKAKVVSGEEAERWRGEQVRRSKQGCFLACVNMVIVSATRTRTSKPR